MTEIKTNKSDQSDLDEHVINKITELKPWNTARFKFFNFIRTWCMSIFVVSCIFPIIFSLGNLDEYNHTYLFFFYFLFLMVAITVDLYMVPKAPDQKITIKEICAYLCTDSLDRRDKFLRDKLQKIQFRLVGNLLLISIFPIIVFILLSNFTSDRIWFDITLIISVGYFAYFLFYKYPRSFTHLFTPPSTWRPDIKLFLHQNEHIFGDSLDLFLIPYFIGIFIYFTFISGFIGALVFLTINAPITMKGSDFVLWSIVRYGFIVGIIGYIHIPIQLTSGLKYIHVAKELIKRTDKP